MKRILYLAAGNPVEPSVGMDLVVAQHIRELAEAQDLDVTVIAVAPGLENQTSAGVHELGGQSLQLFVGDLLHEKGGLDRILKKIRFIFGRAVPVMAYSFKSSEASHAIKRLLRDQQYDVILLDHYYALSNVSLGDIKRSKSKLIYISHDAMFPHIGEMANMKDGLAAKFYYFLEAVRTHLVERVLFKHASRIVHLSQYERSQVTTSVDKHVALLPPISKAAEVVSPESIDPAYQNAVIFIGSPGHPPNAHAINWILDRFAPVLAQVAPSVQIALIGGGTQKLQVTAPNVKGYGFVSSADMQRMLASCICAISPVVRGRGIKVKVLDAIAAGCPVMATEESLRGFEQFGLPANINPDRPEELAQSIANLAASQAQRLVEREKMQALWAGFLKQRSGQLAQIVRTAN